MQDFNIRNYNNAHFTECNDLLKAARDLETTDFRECIQEQSVPSNHSDLKTDGLAASGLALLNINRIKEKIDSTVSLLMQFESEVGETTSYINNTTDYINSILNEVNSALVRISDSLNGVGEYEGKTITADDLKEAGIDEEKCNRLRNRMWVDFMSNDEAVASFIDRVNTSAELSSEDQKKLENIYDHYVDHRYNYGSDVTSVPEARLKNCADVYELLNPEAKRIFDEKFGKAYDLHNANVDKNILRIKYTLYTSDPELRDMMLKYMDDDRLTIVVDPTKKKGGYYAADHVITLNLFNDDENSKRCCGYFHEFGHFIDSVTGENGKDSSLVLSDTLKSDLRDNLTETAMDYNSKLSINVRLSEDGISTVVDYIMDTTTNPNVVLSRGQDPILPEEWTEEQKNLYIEIRNKYGYQEYVYNDYVRNAHGPAYSNGVYTRCKGNDTYGIVDDTIAGLTNGKIGASVIGHPYDIKSGTTKPSVEDFQEEVRTDYYYYDPSSTDPNNHPMYNPEFFAEVFEYTVIDKDLTATREIFGKTVEQVEGIIQDICERN